MTSRPVPTQPAAHIGQLPGNLSAEVRETHTGVVVLMGDKAYKAKKPVVTDFLDFRTAEARERACMNEIALNSRLAPDSYLGIAHFTDPEGGPAEPVIVMRRYADEHRLATMVKSGQPVEDELRSIAEALARFHAGAARGADIDRCATAEAAMGRWQQNLGELRGYAGSVVAREAVDEIDRLATRFISGRGALFAQRITARRIVDGHADLLADDIFCLPEGPVMLDCLEFDDQLRYVDGIDDAAFLAMDLEFLGRKHLGDILLDSYTRCAGDDVPKALIDLDIAYRAVVRAKVDCVRYTQGRRESAEDARRHLDIALDHLRGGAVHLIVVGGGPGTGKTTLAHALAEQLSAQVISTDDVRRQLHQQGVIHGNAGLLNAGLYTPDNVAAVYDAVLARAHRVLSGGQSVILDGTWRDVHQRGRAYALAAQTASVITEFNCVAPPDEADARIHNRKATTSDATPEIAAALRTRADASAQAHHLNTARPLAETVAEAQEIISARRTSP